MSDYDEGYRAGMQKMREVGQRRIEELEAELEKQIGYKLDYHAAYIQTVEELHKLQGETL